MDEIFEYLLEEEEFAFTRSSLTSRERITKIAGVNSIFEVRESYFTRNCVLIFKAKLSLFNFKHSHDRTEAHCSDYCVDHFKFSMVEKGGGVAQSVRVPSSNCKVARKRHVTPILP